MHERCKAYIPTYIRSTYVCMRVCMYVCTNHYIHVLLRLARKEMGEPVNFLWSAELHQMVRSTCSPSPHSLSEHVARFLGWYAQFIMGCWRGGNGERKLWHDSSVQNTALCTCISSLNCFRPFLSVEKQPNSGLGSSQAPLPTQHITDEHPCPQRDSNLRS
jgi:hypothetical protein